MAGAADSRVVLHVPHGSTVVPAEVRRQLLLSGSELDAELAAMTDSGSSELADRAASLASRRPWTFANRLSRLVVDPERFPDEREVMRSVGMGAVYSRTSAGRPLRTPDLERDEQLLDHYFHPYAAALADLVDERLQSACHVVLLDVHSYPRQRLPYEIHPDDLRPEICLGTQVDHTPGWLVDAAVQAFQGFDVALDQPFSGTYVSLRHYQRQRRVHSLMLEVRRDLPPDGPAVTAGLVSLLDAVEAARPAG